MQPHKEINIEVTEKRDYNKRMLWGRGWALLISLIVFSLFAVLNVPDFLPYAFFCIIYFGNEFRIRITNKHFVTKIKFTSLYTEVTYKYKNEERILQGTTSDFNFKLKRTEWKKYPEYYMVINFQGKNVIRQFNVDNWNDGRIKQVVKDISLLKSIEFIDPALNSFVRKFIRLFFPKFNFD